jgi:hypothetical protein
MVVSGWIELMGGAFQLEGGVCAVAIGAVEQAARAEAARRAKPSDFAEPDRFIFVVLSRDAPA